MPAIRRNALRSLENQNPKALLKRNAVVPTPFRRIRRCVVAEPFVERHRANTADIVHNGVVAHIDANVAPNRTRIRMSMGRNGDDHTDAKFAQIIVTSISLEHVVGILVVIGEQLSLTNTI